jgi:chromate reductase
LSVPVEPNNAIDWASRPSGVDSFNGKPVAIVSASIGILRGARAQYHLSQFFVFQNMHPVNAPEVIVTFAKDMFDANGALVDNTTVS